MKKLTLLVFLLVSVFVILAQEPKKDVLKFEKPGYSYYTDVIMKQLNNYYSQKQQEKPHLRLTVDLSTYELPNKKSLYKYFWHNKTVSQGNTGTCWDFSTTSFFESEIYRLYGKKVKLSEMWTAYWEYVEKAREFVRTQGKSIFEEGSEANAVKRMWKKYGVVPQEAYIGKAKDMPFYDHSKMFKEMKTFLNGVKKNNLWNSEFVVSTIKQILNKYMGEPPKEFYVNGKKYTPKSYLQDYLKLNLDDYVDILSLKQFEYWTQQEYPVPDNWWHDKSYYNVPLDVFMDILNNAIKNGYTVSIGGDVSEPGFDRKTQCAIVPTFDIPSEYIDENARQFRFSNKTTTDDHGMHLVGWTEYKGKNWYLIKDSSSGSRTVDPNSEEFGYYFFHEDYIKLKMMDFMVHKNAIPKKYRKKMGL